MELKTKFDRALHEAYVLAYREAIPPADFDKLEEDAPLDENGLKVIPFEDYFLNSETTEEILASVAKKYRLNVDAFNKLRLTYSFGCSPTTIRKKDARNFFKQD